VKAGRPLITGVLETNKQTTFDIIGDLINVTVTLQSTDLPGFVQISQATYNKVVNGIYTIESRGEIKLKGNGKGKEMTDIVRAKERK
jgi:class 3 adenylate cyclase